MRSCCDWQPQIHRGIWFGPLATPLPIIMSGYRQKLKMAEVDHTDLGRVAPVPEAVRPSVLASKLRSLWASGHISGLAVQELSMASLLDGVHGNDIAHMAAFGAFGEQQGNAARDMHRHMSKNIMLPLPHGVQVPCMDPSSGEYAQEQAYMFLPHEVFSALGNHYPEECVAMFNTAEIPGCIDTQCCSVTLGSSSTFPATSMEMELNTNRGTPCWCFHRAACCQQGHP